MRYASVIVDVLNQDVDRIFTYAIPEALNIEVGVRVLVPFGRQGNIEGVVIALTNETDVPLNKIKYIKFFVRFFIIYNKNFFRISISFS